MRFAVEAPHREGGLPVWDDSDALVHLDRLIARADEAAHEVVLRDADLLDESEWFRGARPQARDRLLELCELARASAWTTPSARRASWPVTTLAEAERALRMANSPVKILVENRLRDGALLEVAVRLLAGEALRLLWTEPADTGGHRRASRRWDRGYAGVYRARGGAGASSRSPAAIDRHRGF